jgi:hypothetical protein
MIGPMILNLNNYSAVCCGNDKDIMVPFKTYHKNPTIYLFMKIWRNWVETIFLSSKYGENHSPIEKGF